MEKKEQLLNCIDAYRNLLELWYIESPLYSNRIKKSTTYDILAKLLKLYNTLPVA